MPLDEKTERLKQLLGGKVVTTIYRHRPNEIVVEFSDGSRLTVDAPSNWKPL